MIILILVGCLKSVNTNYKMEERESKRVKLSNEIIKIDIDAQDNEGNTALMQIIDNYTDEKIVEDLINMGANIDIKNNEGNTALMIAISNRREDIAKLLLHKGANINDIYKYNNYTILMKSIGNNMNQLSKDILDKCSSDNLKSYNTQKYTALAVAIVHKKEGLALSILDKRGSKKETYKGSNSYISNEDDDIVLSLAINNKLERVAIELINRDADLKILDNRGNTLLMLAIEKNLKEVVKLIVAKGANLKISNQKIQQKDISLINFENSEGKTAFMIASQKGKEYIDLLKEVKKEI